MYSFGYSQNKVEQVVLFNTFAKNSNGRITDSLIFYANSRFAKELGEVLSHSSKKYHPNNAKKYRIYLWNRLGYFIINKEKHFFSYDNYRLVDFTCNKIYMLTSDYMSNFSYFLKDSVRYDSPITYKESIALDSLFFLVRKDFSFENKKVLFVGDNRYNYFLRVNRNGWNPQLKFAMPQLRYDVLLQIGDSLHNLYGDSINYIVNIGQLHVFNSAQKDNIIDNYDAVIIMWNKLGIPERKIVKYTNNVIKRRKKAEPRKRY